MGRARSLWDQTEAFCQQPGEGAIPEASALRSGESSVKIYPWVTAQLQSQDRPQACTLSETTLIFCPRETEKKRCLFMYSLNVYFFRPPGFGVIRCAVGLALGASDMPTAQTPSPGCGR